MSERDYTVVEGCTMLGGQRVEIRQYSDKEHPYADNDVLFDVYSLTTDHDTFEGVHTLTEAYQVFNHTMAKIMEQVRV